MGTLKVEYQSFDLRDLESRFWNIKVILKFWGIRLWLLKTKRKLALFDTDHTKIRYQAIY